MALELYRAESQPQAAEFFPTEQLVSYTGFFGPETCQTLLAEVISSSRTPQSLIGPESDKHYNAEVRKTQQAFVGRSSQAFVTQRLMSLRQELAAHFQVRLMACQPPQFLIYQPGDFFLAHSDVLSENQPISRRRTLTAVIFLNSPEDIARPYVGGELMLYAFHKDEKPLGYPLQVQTGQLVVFPSGLLHEVLPVQSGVRYTLISWFY